MGDFSRRQFLKMMAVSAAGAVAYTGCTPFPTRNEFLAQSPALIPEDTVTGVDNWYASVCRECRAGCGIIVRVDEGRALKIEGNPEYPVNRGALCARGQAGVQSYYHPDRLRGPLRRLGDRGSGKFEDITWDGARQELLARLRDVAAGANAGTLLFVTEPLAGHRAYAIDRFTTALGGQNTAFDSLPQTVVAAAVRRVFGQEQLPYFDIGRSQYLLSFGADFLGTWLSPVQYNRAYGEFRQGRPNRGYFVQVEPRLSQTGANADEWLPVRPGTEGILAMSIAQVLVAEGLADLRVAQAMLGAAGPAALDAFAPQRVAQAVGVRAERISELAHNFANQRPALAIGGDQAAAHTTGLFNLTAIYTLNLLVGNVGRPGGVLFNPPSPLQGIPAVPLGAPFADWQRLTDRLRGGQPRPVNLLLLHNANPVYGLPRSLGFGDALSKVPYIVSFSSFLDETTALADLILPDHVALETWGDEIPSPQPGIQTVGIQQPVVNPLHDTRDYVDELLWVVGQLGGEVKTALPWSSYRDLLRARAQPLQALGRGTVTGTDFEQFWNTLLQKGGWWDERAVAAGPATPPSPPSLPAQPPQPSFAGRAEEYGFHLIVYPHIALGEGEWAYLPWMQATPDPMTTVAWQSWVEINPETAKEMGVAQGDIIAVESPEGTIEVPAYPYPAIPRDVVAVPLGQGHKSYGRWAKDRGVNPVSILAPLTEAETGALAWAATRVKLRRTGRRIDLPTYQGGVPAVELEPGQVVQVVKE